MYKFKKENALECIAYVYWQQIRFTTSYKHILVAKQRQRKEINSLLHVLPIKHLSSVKENFGAFILTEKTVKKVRCVPKFNVFGKNLLAGGMQKRTYFVGR